MKRVSEKRNGNRFWSGRKILHKFWQKFGLFNVSTANVDMNAKKCNLKIENFE